MQESHHTAPWPTLLHSHHQSLCAGTHVREGMHWPIARRFGAQHVFLVVLCTAAVPVGILLVAPEYQAIKRHQALHLLDIT